MQSSDIGICMVVTPNNYYQTRYVIENLIVKTNITGGIYIYLVGSDDSDCRLLDYLKSNQEVKKLIVTYDNKNLASLKNKLIERVTEKYICFFPANLIVNIYWAETLIENYHNFVDAGVVGIRNDSDNLFFKPLLRHHATKEDYLENVLSNDTDSVEGLIFFQRDLFQGEQPYDIDLEAPLEAPGYSDMQLSYLVKNKGFNNFYCKEQIALKIDVKDDFLYPSKTKEGLNNFIIYKRENPTQE
jgi:hypothetical protein